MRSYIQTNASHRSILVILAFLRLPFLGLSWNFSLRYLSYGLWVFDVLLPDHAGLPHVLDLTVHLVHLSTWMGRGVILSILNSSLKSPYHIPIKELVRAVQDTFIVKAITPSILVRFQNLGAQTYQLSCFCLSSMFYNFCIYGMADLLYLSVQVSITLNFSLCLFCVECKVFFGGTLI